jgi:hypothetical protein
MLWDLRFYNGRLELRKTNDRATTNQSKRGFT